MLDVVVFLVSLGVRVIRAMCRRRADLVLENVALRQQVTALKKERPRPPLEDTERAFWVAVPSIYSSARTELDSYPVCRHHVGMDGRRLRYRELIVDNGLLSGVRSRRYRRPALVMARTLVNAPSSASGRPLLPLT